MALTVGMVSGIACLLAASDSRVLFHYIAKAHVLLKRPSWPAVLDGFRYGAGWVGRTVHPYADGAGIARKDATGILKSYLIDIRARLRP